LIAPTNFPVKDVKIIKKLVVSGWMAGLYN